MPAIDEIQFAAARSIGDYGIIGNCRSSALVSRDGSIDWLCWPHHSSPAVFAALLDELSGGRFAVRPLGPSVTRRSYVDDTNVLQTWHVVDGGEVRVTDCMTVESDADKTRRLLPEHELLRVVECTEGRVEVAVLFQPRADYGRLAMRLQPRGPRRVACQYRGSALVLDASVPLEVVDSSARAVVSMRAGESIALSLTHAHGMPAVVAGTDDALERLDRTIAWWRAWTSRCTYRGQYRRAVVRSLLTLKLLTFAPSGAVIAAPTTSLPEAVGGTRNWDYRFCWIRDASFVVSRLLDVGYAAEAAAYLSWLLHTTRRTAPRLRVCYDVFGQPRTPERVIPWLSGFRQSRPVRVGNAAHAQLQLDCYGEVIAAVADFVARGGELDPASRRLLRGFGTEICESWRQPDEGIWELRSGRRHNTHSKLMCWVGLDRLLRLHADGALDVPAERFAHERDQIASAIHTRGFDPRRNTYVSWFGGDQLDASLLLIAHHRFIEPRDPRAIATRRCIEAELADGPLLARYRSADGLPGEEGAFALCAFWLVAALAEQGEHDRARAHLEALLACANDLGLFAEEIAWDGGEPLGNFPQGFAHVGAIHAALAVSAAAAGREPDTDDEEAV